MMRLPQQDIDEARRLLRGLPPAVTPDPIAAPLYSASEAARWLSVPKSTFHNWVSGYSVGERHGEPVLSSTGGGGVPFIGLAEGLLLAAFRRQGVTLQRIRRCVEVLKARMGVEHALASKQLLTDGQTLLWELGNEDPDLRDLRGRLVYELDTGQRVLRPVLQMYLHRIEYGRDGLAMRLALPITRRPIVFVDPRINRGQPHFRAGRVPLDAVVSRIRAGEPEAEVAAGFGLPPDDVSDVVFGYL